MGWIFVVMGGIIEIFWVSGLKYANSHFLYILTGIGIICSFTLAILACKKLEVSIVYAVFTGIGTAGVVLSEMIIFNEPFSLARVMLILILLIGVIGLKLTSKENDNEVASGFSHELGLDEISKDN